MKGNEKKRVAHAKDMFDEASDIVKCAKKDYESKRTKSRSNLLKEHMRNKLRAFDKLYD